MTHFSILNLQISNFMRVQAVEISPNGSPVIQITGRNAEGKSSVINAIWAALQWRAASGSITDPVRRGQESAKVRIDLGDMIITRIWKDKKVSLTVTTREGAKYPSPQSVLDKLVSEIGFDPLAFTRMQPRDQRATLMNLLKIDFSQFDQERSELLKQKLVADNQVTSLTQQLSSTQVVPEETPDEEISAGDIIRQIQEATAQATEKEKTINAILINSKTIEEKRERIESLQRQLQELYEIQEELEKKVTSINPESIEPLQNQLTNIETINKQVRQKQQKSSILEHLQQAEKAVTQITENISLIDQDKRDCLESAKFPVPGLSFDESGILLNGVPFAQASTAEQIRVSLAMGIALNPDLRVLLIRDGNALDSTSLGIVSQMAEEAEMQIWMERVDESGVIGVCIEDGTVKAAPVAPGQQVIA